MYPKGACSQAASPCAALDISSRCAALAATSGITRASSGDTSQEKGAMHWLGRGPDEDASRSSVRARAWYLAW